MAIFILLVLIIFILWSVSSKTESTSSKTNYLQKNLSLYNKDSSIEIYRNTLKVQNKRLLKIHSQELINKDSLIPENTNSQDEYPRAKNDLCTSVCDRERTLSLHKTVQYVEKTNNTPKNPNPTNRIEFLVLTKSAKYSEYCIAGIDIYRKCFVRLVGNKYGAEIKKRDFVYNNKEIDIFDVIDVEVEDAPLKIQIENKILRKIYKVIRHITIEELISCIPSIQNGKLLNTVMGKFSEYNQKYSGSLMIISAQNLSIKNIEKYDGSKKTKADFTYDEKKYCDFSVTDYDYFQTEITLASCILIISISEKPYPYDMKYHHFIAKIIPLDKRQFQGTKVHKSTLIIEPMKLGENLYEITGYTRCILRCVYETKGHFGITVIIKILTGSKDKQIEHHKLCTLNSYAILKNVNKDLIKEIIKRLLKKGYLEQTISRYPLIKIGPNAMKVHQEVQFFEDTSGLIKK